jgi:hypothetical protein
MTSNFTDPELDTITVIVESEAVRNINGVTAWRITGRTYSVVLGEISRLIRNVGENFAQFTNPAYVHGGPYSGWYFAMGITSDVPFRQED